MLETIIAYIEQHKLLPQQGTVVVAVSGGADSLCLLHLLHRLCGPGRRYPTIQLHAAHLNHQLRGQASAEEAAAVTRLVSAWGLPISSGSIDVHALARHEQRSLEDAARVARYRFLREVAAGEPIAVAHHMDDQAETLILHWLRGGGLSGMIGLQPRQQDIIRPLLAVTHADTVAYCQQQHLVPLEDESNSDTRFLRNRIRHELLPLLATINPAIRETLIRNAEVIRVDAEWIEQQVTSAWSSVVSAEQEDQIQMQLTPLLALPLSLQRHLLRRVTARLSDGQSPLELRHFVLIEALLGRASSSEELTLHLPRHIQLIRYAETITFKQRHKPETEAMLEKSGVVLTVPGRIEIPGTPWIARAEFIADDTLQAVLAALQRNDWAEVWRILPFTRYSVYIDGASVGPTLYVRTRRAGDRMRPLGMEHEKKVQDVLVDQHIARSERDLVPLFFSSAHCVWLAGVQIDDRVRLTSRTQSIVRLSIASTTVYK